MADHGIDIPFGPDKTGGMGIEPLEPETPAETDGIDVFVTEQPAADSSLETPTTSFVVPDLPVIDSEGNLDAGIEVQRDEYGYYAVDNTPPREPSVAGAGGITEEEANAQGLDDVQMSFLALKDSIGQSRELKARDKEINELNSQIEADREELADRDEILANYQSIVTELDARLARHNADRSACKSEYSQVMANIESTTAELSRMKEHYAEQMQPLENELARVQMAAEQAKNDERSRKSELNAAESEARRAEAGEDANIAAVKQQQAAAAHEEARLRSESAKEQLAQVQQIYDEAIKQIEHDQSPLERSIEEMTERSSALKDEIARLDEEITTARDRRQYCDTVYQYPDETEQLRAKVAADEATAAKLDAEYEELNARLAESKAKAKKAKVAIGIVIAIIVVAIVAFVIVSGR